jgi:hydrogenase maturation protease
VKRILIAGIGNIFLGDDAFGVEVVRLLATRSFPENVTVRDFGIRGYDLACALTDGYDAAILVDAAPLSEPPGTVFLLEPDLDAPTPVGRGVLTAPPQAAESPPYRNAVPDGHSMDPVRVLQFAATLGTRPRHLYLVGCEPGPLEDPAGCLGLSDAVRSAVPKAADLIQSLVGQLLSSETKIDVGLLPA